jgi:hypothetical protein
MDYNIDENWSGQLSSVHRKSVGYNSKNSKFEKNEKQKPEKSNNKQEKSSDKLENRLIYHFHSKFEF